MRVIDIAPEHESIYFECLEDWSEEMKEAGTHKETWYKKYKKKGLRVKFARSDKNIIGGMIQYLPIEESFVEGEDLYFVMCVWVHGHKQGRGDLRKQGMGQALLFAAEADAQERGAKGLAAWGLRLPFWMKASWFIKQGYKKAHADGMKMLVWKPFTEDAKPPKWIKQKKEVTADIPGKVSVKAFINGWCSAQNIVFERVRKASKEFGDKVNFQVIDTSERETFLEWGIVDSIFIDGKELRHGPPLSYKKIKKAIEIRIRKLT